MSLLLDALHRSRSGDRPEKGGRTAHADQVLATLGYSPQPHRPGAIRLAIVLAGVAVLGAAGYWGLPLLLGRPSQRAASQPPSQTKPVAGKGRPAPPDVPPREAPATRPLQIERATAPAPAPVAPIPERQAVAPPAATTARATAPTRRMPAPAVRSTAVAAARSRRARPPLGGPAASPAGEPSRPDDFRLALYYQRSGDFERALTHYRAVLERNELNAEAHNNLGLLYQQKGLAPEAVREFQRAIAINARYARAHNNLGVAWMRQGNLDLARAEFQAALSVDSGDTDALVNLALAEKAARQPEAAKTTLIRALAIDPGDAAAHYNLALLYDESGETARAVEHYRGFLEHAGVEHADLAPDVRARVDQLASRPR